MIIVEAREARERLTMEKTIGLMREALTLLEDGTAYQPPRTVLTIPHGNSFGFMPAYMGDNDYFGAKVITAFHGNLGTEYPSHMGYVMIFESVHGSPVGMADCSVITEIRTGAVSGVATDLLARKDVKKLAIIGHIYPMPETEDLEDDASSGNTAQISSVVSAPRRVVSYAIVR